MFSISFFLLLNLTGGFEVSPISLTFGFTSVSNPPTLPLLSFPLSMFTSATTPYPSPLSSSEVEAVTTTEQFVDVLKYLHAFLHSTITLI